MIEKINVFYHSRLVGDLTLSKYDKSVLFKYSKEWLNDGFSISPYSLPLEDKYFSCGNSLFKGLFGVFADSLPDAWGELLFNRFVEKNNIKISSILDRLTYIGSSGMGALEYKPEYNHSYPNRAIDLDIIQKECEMLLDSQKIENIENLYHLGSSSGGARPKILIAYEGKHLLVKFSSKYDGSDIAKKEFDYMNLAKKCGINIPYIQLIKTEHNSYYAIERFDRKNNEKIHMISVAALLECDFRSPCLDYLDLLRLTRALTNNGGDVIEMFRRMVFNVFFDNQDDHAKNFSFLYDDQDKKYKLSPAYDLTPGKTYYGEHTTSVNMKGKDIGDNDMIAVAKKAFIDVKIAKEIISQIREVKKNSEYGNY